MSKRALRRHHRSRIQAKTLRIINNPTCWDERPQTLADPWVYRRVDNFSVCSCPMCGNPRRHRAWANRPNWNGRTRAERLAELALAEQLAEVEAGSDGAALRYHEPWPRPSSNTPKSGSSHRPRTASS